MMNLAAAFLYAMSTSTLAAILLGFLFSGLDSHSALTALGCGFCVAVFSLLRRPTFAKMRGPRGWEWCAVLLFAWFTVRAFLWLVTVEGDEIKTVVWNNGGDLSLHLGFIRYLANGAPFWPESPIFAGGKMTYAVGADLFNSLLLLAGMDVYRGLVIVGLICCALTGVALWRWGRAFTMAGFLCNGGLVALVLFLPHSVAQAVSGSPVGFPEADGWPAALDLQGALAWKSIPISMLITQRGFLFALPAGLLLLCSWRARFFAGQGSDEWRMPVWGELLLYASLPIFHVHTFIALSLMLLAFFLACPVIRKPVLRFVGIAFLPATLLVWLAMGMLQSSPPPRVYDMEEIENPPPRPASKVLGWKPGWMSDDEATLRGFSQLGGDPSVPTTSGRVARFAYFWLLNFGALPFLIIALVVWMLRLVFRKRVSFSHAFLWCAAAVFLSAVLDGWNPANSLPLIVATVLIFCLLLRIASGWHQQLWPAVFVLPSVYLFFLCCNVKFAPWEWDNTKVMMWAYLIVLPFAWEFVVARLRFWMRMIVCEVLFFSGFITLFGALRPDMPYRVIASKTELELVERAVRDIPITEPILSHPSHDHPLLLVGRRVVLGYPGHIASHGMDPTEHQSYIAAIMQGTEEWRILAAELGAHYLFWGKAERDAYGGDSQGWRESQIVGGAGDFEIFDLAVPALPLEADGAESR